jgi:hypothetical protein
MMMGGGGGETRETCLSCSTRVVRLKGADGQGSISMMTSTLTPPLPRRAHRFGAAYGNVSSVDGKVLLHR